jgi:hypothetical protein
MSADINLIVLMFILVFINILLWLWWNDFELFAQIMFAMWLIFLVVCLVGGFHHSLMLFGVLK